MKSITASAKALSHQDYGVTYSESECHFRVWAPSAAKMRLALYEAWDDIFRETYDMSPSGDGSWWLALPGNHLGKYYNYLLQDHISDRWLEVLDPYAKASGPNALKGLIVDLTLTDPPGFREQPELPLIHPMKSVIYELHVRDFTISPSAGVQHPGKYLGLTQSGTQIDGLSTGLDHLVELGVTHVHIMPVSDFVTVNELNPTGYNWGYDPIQFNVPEGSYATSPYGAERISELKQMIMAMHQKGLRVVLDVVYNHTYYTDGNFACLAPDYFYRMRGGQLTNGSGCGNELNFSKPMVQKFLLDSLAYWKEEYLVDGFRFDLMGLYDQETVDMIVKTLRDNKTPTFMIYGEPWVGGHSGLQQKKMFLKGSQKGKYIAIFNDEYRDAIKGDNDGCGKGLVSGQGQLLYQVKKGIAGEIEFSKQLIGFAEEPIEVINYICAHDNLILRDKIEKVSPEADEYYRLRINRLAFTLMLMSYGTPFIHEGTEFYRTKYHDHNSYQSSDAINQVDWRLKGQYYDFYAFIKEMIAFRKASGLFNKSADEIRRDLKFQNVEGIGYTIMHEGRTYCFYHNYYDVPIKRQLPKEALIHCHNDYISVLGSHCEARHMVEVDAKSSLIYSVEAKVTVSPKRSRKKD